MRWGLFVFLVIFFIEPETFAKNLEEIKVFPLNTKYWIGMTPHLPYQDGFGFFLHLGVDLKVRAGTSVLSPVEGLVQDHEAAHGDHWYYTVTVKIDGGDVYYFRHMDRSTTRPIIEKILREGGRAQKENLIGYVADAERREFPMFSSYSLEATLPISHIHFGVYNCEQRIIYNTLKYLNYIDTIKPQVASVKFFNLHSRKELSAHSLKGVVDMTALATDEINNNLTTYSPLKIKTVIKDRNGKVWWQNEAFDHSFFNVDVEDRAFCGENIDKTLFPEKTQNNIIIQTYNRGGQEQFINQKSVFEIKLTGKQTKFFDSLAVSDGSYILQITVTDAKENSGEFTQAITINNKLDTY